MRCFVSWRCIGCGLCVAACPAVFKMSEEGVARTDGTEVPEELVKQVKSAMERCPRGAIEAL